MEREAKHSVQKYSFEINYDSEKEAIEFQNELASFIREELITLSDELFTKAAPNNHYRIQRLELDLGDICKEGYREEVTRKFKDQLSEKLNLLIFGYQIDSLGTTAEVIYSEKSDLESFKYFLNNGVLPWSSFKGDTHFSVNVLFRTILQNSPLDLKRLIESQVRDKTIFLRIIRQLEEENLWRLINCLEREESIQRLMRVFYTGLIRIYSQKKVFKNNLSEYKELIWGFLFDQIFYKKNNSSAVSFFESFVNYVSAALSVSEKDVIEVLKKTIYPDSEFSFSKSRLTISPELNEMHSGLKEFILHYSSLTKSQKKEGEEFSTRINEAGIADKDVKDAFLSNAERSERFRTEQLDRKKKLIFDFLRLAMLPEGKSLLSHIVTIEQAIGGFLSSDVYALKKIFSSLTFSFEKYSSFQTLEYFSEPIRKTIIQEVYRRSYEEYEKLKITTAAENLNAFLKSEVSASFYSVFQQKDWNELVDLVLSNEAESIFLLVKEPPAHTVYRQVEFLKESISAVLKKKHKLFFDQVEQYFKSLSLSPKIEIAKEEVLLSSVISSHQEIHYLLLYLQNNKLPEECRFVVKDLLDSFLIRDKDAVFSFILSLQRKEQKRLISLMSESFRDQLKEISKKNKAEVEKLLKVMEQDMQNPPASETNEGKLKKETDDPLYNSKKIQEGEPVYISNAGLVIFHPYLSRFFNMLGLLDQKRFKDDYSAHKAAHILQYLATKNTFTEEHELFLNKILCGIEPIVPLMREIEITEEEKSVCENLIGGVIANWPILKKTSNDNFRASFLLREGKMVLEDQGWRLRVEERAYDILVEKIPWSLGMVMLPWMKKLIYVEWK